MSAHVMIAEAPRCRACGAPIALIFAGRYAFWLCEACRTPGESGAWQDFISWPEASRRREIARWEVV